MAKFVNLAIDDELFNKIEKQRGNIALDKFIVNKLKERIEEYETRDFSPEVPADKFSMKKEYN